MKIDRAKGNTGAETLVRSTRGSRPFGVGFAAAATLLVACGNAGPETPTEFDESGDNGRLGGGLVQKAAALRDLAPIADGSDDPALRAALQMSGARRAFPFKSHETVSELAADAATRQLRNDGATSTEGEEETVYVGLVTPKGHYRVEFDAKTFAKTLGKAQSTVPATSTEQRGWSEAIDNRVATPTTDPVNIRVGQVTTSFTSCSGATIGRRLVRTAAHCVVQHTTGGGSPAASVTYNQARNGAFIRATDTTSTYWYGGQYISKGCGTRTAADQNSGFRANVNGCVVEDWALLVLSSNWFSEAGSTAWFNPVATSTVAAGALLHGHGYPGCDDTAAGEGAIPHDPAGCRAVPNSHYRDASDRCTVGSFLVGSTSFRSGCDSSPGNSGGPVIARGTSQHIGSLSWADCGTCTSTTLAPNRYIGHNQFLIDFQNQLNNENP